MGLIGAEVEPLALAAKSTKPIVADDLDLWERRIEREVATDNTLPETERMAIIRARKGQGLFKDRVSRIEIEVSDNRGSEPGSPRREPL